MNPYPCINQLSEAVGRLHFFNDQIRRALATGDEATIVRCTQAIRGVACGISERCAELSEARAETQREPSLPPDVRKAVEDYGLRLRVNRDLRALSQPFFAGLYRGTCEIPEVLVRSHSPDDALRQLAVQFRAELASTGERRAHE